MTLRVHRSYLLALCLGALAACGGSGGGSSGGRSAGGTSSGTAPVGQPKIRALVMSFPSDGTSGGGTPNSSVGVVVENEAGTDPIPTASVTLNGVPLTYAPTHADYAAQLNLDPGAAVNLSVTVGGVAYTASAERLSAFPTVLEPDAGTTWSSPVTNVIRWLGAPNYDGHYALSVTDANGKIIWPANQEMLIVPASQRDMPIGGGGLGTGVRLVRVGMVGFADIAGAAPGSQLVLGDFDSVAIDVTMTGARSLNALAMSSANATVAPGKTRQLWIKGTYSDGSTQDVTAKATWSSSDPTKVAVNSKGLATGVALGAAVVTAQLSGLTATARVSVFQPNPSPPPPLSESVTYQIDYAHSGRATVGGKGPSFPPSAHWSTTLNATVSYPVIASGEVIVLTGMNATGAGTASGAWLYALDESDGKVTWGPVAISNKYPWAGQAYDHGKVLVVNYQGLLRSFDAATGAADWSRQLPGGAFSAPPTAVNGVVYVGGVGVLSAVSESSGALLWTAPVNGGEESSPAVSPDGVFVSYPCQAYKFDPLDGTALWHYDGGCYGGGGKTSMFADGFLYVRDPPEDQIFDAATGKAVGTFSATVIPAVSGDSAYYLLNGTLSAVDRMTQSTRWTFASDGKLDTAPLVIDSAVVIGAASGTVYALDAATGSVLWSGQAAGAISRPDEQNVSAPLVGLGAGGGYLVVPSGNVVNAWKIAP